MKRRLTAYITLILTVAVATIATADMTYHGNRGGARRVLIATEATRYKNRLVDALIEKLDDGATMIVEVDHQAGGLDGVDPRDYAAVFITNSGAQAMVRPQVMRWLERYRAHDDNVILHTTQITDWDPPVQVDSITSASRMRNIGDLTDDVVRRIGELAR